MQEAFLAFHPNPKLVQKFLKPLLIGELAVTEPSQDRNKNVSVAFGIFFFYEASNHFGSFFCSRIL